MEDNVPPFNAKMKRRELKGKKMEDSDMQPVKVRVEKLEDTLDPTDIPKIVKIKKVMHSKRSGKIYCQVVSVLNGKKCNMQIEGEKVRKANPQMLLDYYENNIVSKSLTST